MAEPLYGFVNLKELWNERVVDNRIPLVRRAIEQSVEEHNRQINALLNLFAVRTTEHMIRYKTPTAARLQPLDENGRALPILPRGVYDVAFPILDAGVAWGANYKSRQKMVIEDANDITATMLMADMRWMRDHLMGAIFQRPDWSYNDPEYGMLTVHGLANGDSTIYQIQRGQDLGNTDDHYMAQAAAIDDTNDPFEALYDEVMEHPENSGDLIALIPSNLKADIRRLTGFYPESDPNIRRGANLSELIGSMGAAVPGQLFGYHEDKVWLVEWQTMPDDYIIALPTSGPRPIAMREEPETELQGFKEVATREDHPFWESQWLRVAGFGGWNRVGAAVLQIGAGTYAQPTGYAAPMP